MRDGFASTPYEHWDGKKPNVSHLRVFGTRVFLHIPEADRRKLDPKAIEGLFIGYSETVKAYLIYVPKSQKVITSREVIFMEEVTTNINHQSPTNLVQTTQDEPDETRQGKPDEIVQSSSSSTQPGLRKSKRGLIPKRQWPADKIEDGTKSK